MKNIKIALLTILFSLTSIARSETCYSEAQLNQIAKALQDLEACQNEVKQKDLLIKERLESYDGSPSVAWWQEPGTIGGGLLVSFTLGLVMAYTAAKK